MPGILFYGDPHGEYEPLFEAVRECRPSHVVIVGDCGLMRPLADTIKPVLDTGASVRWIYGNHDAQPPERYSYLFDAEGGLHGEVAALCGYKVAGLGGHYKGKIWEPRNGDEPARWQTREAFLHSHGRGGRWRQGLPLGQRQTIFPEDHARLRAFAAADVLVTHEASTSIGQDKGFGAIDDLACVFRRKAAGDSDSFQPVIPTEASQ